MNASDDILVLATRRPARLERLLRDRLLNRLQDLAECELTVVDGDQAWTFGDGGDDLRATIRVLDPAFYRQVSLGGSIGAGESYMAGQWRCDDLVALVRIMVRNRDLLDAMETGLASLVTSALKWLHRRNRNSRAGSRRNIAAHYDLGNEFFELFLDPAMMYSGAVFATGDESLQQAQQAKLDRICRKLQLGPTDHVLEIGTGWGGFAIHAAGRYGCRVTTTTISAQQHAEACRRVAAAGLEDRVTLLRRDYRDLTGCYRKVVSIEMIEAVGHQYLATYLDKVCRLLAPDGMALIQAITIEDHRYAKAVREVDFIKRHIFPGSFIPSISAICAAAARGTDLRLFHLEDIGADYALTLAAWRQRFEAHLDRVRALGYPESFIRMWRFYLSYCEGGFRERSIGDAQMLFVRPRCQRRSITPPLEA